MAGIKRPVRRDGTGPTPLRNVRIDDETWEEAVRLTKANGTDVSAVMRNSLVNYIRRHRRRVPEDAASA